MQTFLRRCNFTNCYLACHFSKGTHLGKYLGDESPSQCNSRQPDWLPGKKRKNNIVRLTFKKKGKK